MTDDQIYDMLSALVDLDTHDVNLRDHPKAYEIVRRMSEWQPIETAPKDYTKFLAYRRGEVAQAQCFLRDDGEMWTFGSTSGHADVFPEIKPTHWMPLPAAPSTLAPHP